MDYRFILIYGMVVPFISILFFVLGYNIGATTGKKMTLVKHKPKKTEAELMLEKIDKAHL